MKKLKFNGGITIGYDKVIIYRSKNYSPPGYQGRRSYMYAYQVKDMNRSPYMSLKEVNKYLKKYDIKVVTR